MVKDGLINNLPFKFNLPCYYNYCGPGTKLQERLARGNKGINQLNEYCKQHDIAYNKLSDLQERHKADIILLKMAKEWAILLNAGLGEKIAADLVNKTMLAKVVTFGAGIIKKNNKIMSHTKKHMRKLKPKCKKAALELAYAPTKDSGGYLNTNNNVLYPFQKLEKLLIPIFAGLPAAGSSAGAIAGIAKAINEYKTAKRRLTELQRQ